MVSPIPRSFGDFLRRIAFDYVRYGYYRYAVREIPEGKDLLAIDEKLRRTYSITSCRTTRTRRRRQGQAIAQYLRWHHTFVLLVTEGHHETFEKLRSYDIRDTPLHLGAYSVGLRGKTVHIQVTRRVWRRVKRLIRRKELRPHEEVERRIQTLPFYNFPGVVAQKRKLLCQVNRRRKRAGLPRVTLLTPSKEQYVTARNQCSSPQIRLPASERPSILRRSKE